MGCQHRRGAQEASEVFIRSSSRGATINFLFGEEDQRE
jgi:hypothetical protein